jgi:hypothetical protein
MVISRPSPSDASTICLPRSAPGWRPAELPEPHRSSRRFLDYHRVNAKRTRRGDVLTAEPDIAAECAGQVLPAITELRQHIDRFRPVSHGIGGVASPVPGRAPTRRTSTSAG